MKAIVKVAYFDDLGLHRVGDVVEVKALKSYHEPIEEKTPEKPVKAVETPVTEAVEDAQTKTKPKATKKKATKKKG